MIGSLINTNSSSERKDKSDEQTVKATAWKSCGSFEMPENKTKSFWWSV